MEIPYVHFVVTPFNPAFVFEYFAKSINPDGNPHGGLHDKLSHAGDLGNIRNGLVYLRTKKASLTGKRGIVGRSLVLHEGEDDLGSSGDPTGHAGKRLDCAIIGWAAH